MNENVIEINNNTNFPHIMNYANCETKLQRDGKNLVYFKFKSNGSWITLKSGNLITIDDKHNITVIK